MLTLTRIREDLKEIRYYYSHRDVFDEIAKKILQSRVVDKVNQYNLAASFASPWLYELYFGLYVNNNTQENYAAETGFSTEYVQVMNKKLLLFFQSEIKG